jgi:hypothetical protein
MTEIIKLRVCSTKIRNHPCNNFLQVTTDIQMFLHRRVKGTEEDKGILSIEREIPLLKKVR